MNFTIQLPENFETQDIRSLLETEWLVPRKVRHFLRTRKGISINGVVKMFHETVEAGDSVTLQIEESDYPEPTILLGDKELVDILFEDEHLIIVNKPRGMKTHPNQPDEKDTLANHLAAYLVDQHLSPFVVHRLDKETSGAILFAKNQFVLPILGRMLERKEISRVYQGEAQGRMTLESFTIDKKIGRDRHDRRKRRVDSVNGQEATTHVTVEQTTGRTSFIRCQLETGRTHQIRVHMASIDHPLVGDPLYNPKARSSARLMLHAEQLSLLNPFTKEKIEVRAEPGLW